MSGTRRSKSSHWISKTCSRLVNAWASASAVTPPTPPAHAASTAAPPNPRPNPRPSPRPAPRHKRSIPLIRIFPSASVCATVGTDTPSHRRLWARADSPLDSEPGPKGFPYHAPPARSRPRRRFPPANTRRDANTPAAVSVGCPPGAVGGFTHCTHKPHRGPTGPHHNPLSDSGAHTMQSRTLSVALAAGLLATITPFAAADLPEGMVAELIAPNTVRFHKSEDARENRIPSFALVSPRKSIGRTPDDLALVPVYSQEGDQGVVTIDIDPSVDLYGTGQAAGPLRRNGRVTEAWNFDAYGYQDDAKHLYTAHPWVMGVRADGSAFGVLYDSTYRVEMDLTDDIVFRYDGRDQPVIIIDADSPQEVMTTLGDLTGTIEMPPKWAIGYHQCRYSYFPDSRVKEVAQTGSARSDSRRCHLDGHRLHGRLPLLHLRRRALPRPQGAQRLPRHHRLLQCLDDRPGREERGRLLRPRLRQRDRRLGQDRRRQGDLHRLCLARRVRLPGLHQRGGPPLVGRALRRLHGQRHRRRLERHERARRLQCPVQDHARGQPPPSRRRIRRPRPARPLPQCLRHADGQGLREGVMEANPDKRPSS
jgi:hypothetical protein